MMPDLFGSTTIPALGEVLNFAQARHTVLTGNIANVNTPGYRLRDLSQSDFQQKLKEAITASQTMHAPLSPGLAESQPGDAMRQVHASLENLIYHDDTNIDLEKQVAEINKNQYLHGMALQIMTNQMQLLQTAISGGRGEPLLRDQATAAADGTDNRQ